MHTFLALRVSLIPRETKQYVPTFWNAKFSNDGVMGGDGWDVEPSLLLLDGRDGGQLVHPLKTLRAWVQWEKDPDKVIRDLLDTSIEYTREQVVSMEEEPTSLWYVEQESIE